MISNGFIVLLLMAEFICKIFHINGNQWNTRTGGVIASSPN